MTFRMRYIGTSTYRSISQGQYRHYRKIVRNSGQILFTTSEQTLFLKLSNTVGRGGKGKIPLLVLDPPPIGGERHHAWLSSILCAKPEIAAVLAVTKLSQFSISLDVKNKIQADTSQYVGFLLFLVACLLLVHQQEHQRLPPPCTYGFLAVVLASEAGIACHKQCVEVVNLVM